jgi:hypothetical protein
MKLVPWLLTEGLELLIRKVTYFESEHQAVEPGNLLNRCSKSMADSVVDIIAR